MPTNSDELRQAGGPPHRQQAQLSADPSAAPAAPDLVLDALIVAQDDPAAAQPDQVAAAGDFTQMSMAELMQLDLILNESGDSQPTADKQAHKGLPEDLTELSLLDLMNLKVTTEKAPDLPDLSPPDHDFRLHDESLGDDLPAHVTNASLTPAGTLPGTSPIPEQPPPQPPQLPPGPNVPPDAKNDSYTIAEDGTLKGASVLANDTDGNGDHLTASLVTGPLHGTLSLSSTGTFVYHPFANYDGADSFTYKVSDGRGGFDTATASITVTAVNDAPRGTNGAVTIDEDTSHVFSTTDFGFSDPNDTPPNNLLAVTITTLPTAGTLLLNGTAVTAGESIAVADIIAGDLVFQPGADDNGIGYAKFTFQVQDDGGTANGGKDLDPTPNTLTINVTPVNDAPVAADDVASTGEDQTKVIAVLANDTDVDIGDKLQVQSIDTSSTAGTVTLNGNGTVTYDPNGKFESLAVGETATDTFTYTVSDGNGGTDTATVTVTINGANDAPTAVADTASTGEDATKIIAVLGNDADPDASDTLQVISIGTTGTKGSVTNNGDGTVTYDPNGKFESLAVGETATDTFTYTVSDGHGGTDKATVTVTIDGANDAPTAVDDTASTGEDATKVIAVLVNDTDPDTSDKLQVSSIDTSATTGAVIDNGDGTVTYDPNGKFESLAVGETATDTFAYTVSDGHGGTDTATVTVTINGANDAPTAVDDAASTGEDATKVIAVLVNDLDPDTSDKLQVLSIDTSATTGAVVNNGNGTVTYDPNGKFESLAVGETATDTFTYTVSDGHGGTDTATVTVTINGANDSPTANNDTASTGEDATKVIAVLANDTDPDTSDKLQVSSIDTSATTGAVIDNGDGTVTYDPNGKFESLAVGETATDTFAYTVSDGHGGTSTATVTVTVNGANDIPTANNDIASTGEDATTIIAVLGNDTDPDASDKLQVLSIDTSATTGFASINGNGTVTYDPNGKFESLAVGETATDTFNYTVSDGHGGTDTATVTVTINGANDIPSANNDTASTGEDTTTLISAATLLGNDTDPDASDKLQILSIDTSATAGIVTDDGKGTFIYDPNGKFESLAAGDTATDSFNYTVSDGHGGTDTATVTVTIIGANDTPVANDDANAISEDPVANPISGDVLTNDTDVDSGSSLTVVDVNGSGANVDSAVSGLYGTLTLHADGTYTYALNNADPHVQALDGGETLSDSFTYTANDGLANSNSATLTITINGVDGNESLVGSAAADTIAGGNGDDTIDGGGGADDLSGGNGNDAFHWHSDANSIDGGAGTNSLLASGGDIDFSSSHPSVTNIQEINLGTADGASTLTLSAQDVLDIAGGTNSLTVHGDGSDSVNAGAGWTETGPGSHVYTQVVGITTVTLTVDAAIAVNPDITS